MILRAVYTLGKLGLKSKRGKKALSWGAKRLRKKLKMRKQMASYKGLHKDIPLRVKGKKTELRHTFKQKPKHVGGGSAPITSSGFTGDYKVGAHAKRAIWHDTRARGSESWRSEMSRVFGGAHMAQSGAGLKRSIRRLNKSYAKDIRILRKKLKTKLSVGGLVIGKNVDLSLL